MLLMLLLVLGDDDAETAAAAEAAAAAVAALQYLHCAGIRTRDSVSADMCSPNKLHSPQAVIF